jgi:hypothetical protein
MRYQQNAVLTSLSRAQQFITDNSERLSAINPTAVKELNDVAEELATLSVTQESGTRGSKGETARNQSLRTVLRQKHMAPIAAVAKYKLQSVPEFVAMTLPPVTVSAQSLVAAATAMADAAAPHAQTFIDSGLAATFVDDLRSAAKAVSASIVERGNLQGRRNGATAGLAATEKRGRAILRVLHTLLLAQIGDDPQLRRQWVTAKTVQQKPGRSMSTQPATAPAGSPAVPAPVAALVPTTSGSAPTSPGPVPAAA